MQGGDLLGGRLVDRVVVGGDQDVVVQEADLVLPEVALALGALGDQVAQPVQRQHPVVDRLVGSFGEMSHDQCRSFSAASIAANSSSGAPCTMWWRL
jgi:hypothetical protein